MAMQGKKIFAKGMSLCVICVCLLLISVSGSVWAESKAGNHVMTYVRSAPGTWYSGKIDYIDGQVVCIGDVNNWFASDVIFVSRYGFKISQRNFYTGKKVKMLLNSDYKCRILLEI